MKPIQLVLILIAAGFVLFYFNRLRNRLLDRILFFILAVVAVAMVLQPEWANAVAEFLGVGRGADLLVYLGLSGLAFLWLGLYARQREMDIRLTELARRLAKLGAEKPKKRKK